MTITIIGHGYVGIVAACVFADFGNTVYVIGHTPEKLARLSTGDPLIYEPGLQELLQKNIRAGNIRFTTEYTEALRQSAVVFICVGTPPKQETGEADLRTVYAVARKIGEHLHPDNHTVISCKSTVPVGTNYHVREIINETLLQRGITNTRAVFSIASCPEFLREGTGIHDTLHPDRTVIGAEDQRAIDVLLELHMPLPGVRVITNIPSAELIKYASNALLATKISFANTIALFAEKLGADAPDVLRAVGLDNRIGPKNLDVSIGYGGACFPKDVQALIATGRNCNAPVSLLTAVEEINQYAWENYVAKVLQHVPLRTGQKKLAVWGLAFKANTDDIRFAPAVKIVQSLAEKGYTIVAYDPAAMQNVQKSLGNSIQYASTAYGALHQADALCVLTEWNEFKQADMMHVKSILTGDIIIDGRNLYDVQKMRELGFVYISTGR